ncbi:Cytosolic sulfotransferase 16 [Acorus gramineus]|uniref:Sulfotransferase n=1 Tax=Acorus gramineus TaxID=55184 RepID=A0AAV9A422_ACOGR|nr:Cytosolic sulfotransferase 16 [Acorus gramineus]
MEGEETRVDEKTQEKYAHLISTLPKKKSWGRYLHMYHGFWYSSFVLHGVMSVQDNFKAHPSDVLIASFPKSGTTWLKALVFALLNRSTGDQTSKQSLDKNEKVAKAGDSTCRRGRGATKARGACGGRNAVKRERAHIEEDMRSGSKRSSKIARRARERSMPQGDARRYDMMEDPVNGVKRLVKFLWCPFSVEEDEGGVVEEIVHV